MAAYVLRCENGGHEFTSSRPHARTCSHACRQKLYRDAHHETRLPNELRDVALDLVRAGEIEGWLALSYVIAPTPGIVQALERRRERVAA